MISPKFLIWIVIKCKHWAVIKRNGDCGPNQVEQGNLVVCISVLGLLLNLCSFVSVLTLLGSVGF